MHHLSDPLDGTKEFTLGLKDAVTVLIGLALKGKPLAGVVHAPWQSGDKGRTVWGLVGLGAFGHKFVAPPAGRRWIVTSRSHVTEGLRKLIESVNAQRVLRVVDLSCAVLLRLLICLLSWVVFACR